MLYFVLFVVFSVFQEKKTKKKTKKPVFLEKKHVFLFNWQKSLKQHPWRDELDCFAFIEKHHCDFFALYCTEKAGLHKIVSKMSLIFFLTGAQLVQINF